MANQTACIICGGQSFEPGPSGRLTHNGLEPRCGNCRSLERHRTLRLIYNAIPDSFLGAANCLQFAPDRAAPRDRFASFEISVYGGKNHLDMMRIDRADGSYGWVVANHVIEHLANDLAGMGELMRIAGTRGIVQVTVPAPKARLRTKVLPSPDNITRFHFHTYGSDFPQKMKPALGGGAGIAAIATDPCTGSWDVAYFFSASQSRLFDLGTALIGGGVAVLICV
ncbi:hypothetical protein MNBD_ALPHA09-716 [hydrothermal vent metagenome]|uniref:Methyltransferase type 11 domain-containing protein n=1 Tax=hydrothermal vent metagenome TaxID=652676 RepID=A0A3B0T3F5_9ZZZZ